VFRAKRADRIKILVYDGTGLVLYWKALDQGAFKWPPISDGVMRLSPAQLSALTEGMDWTRFLRQDDGVRRPSDECDRVNQIARGGASRA
jgi:transposase